MKKIVAIGLLLLFSVPLEIGAAAPIHEREPWTWLYHKRMTEQEIESHQGKQELLFMRDEIQPFTQLVFSWNALRPAKGHFSFFVSVRDNERKKWGAWHPMMNWGANVQSSTITTGDGHTKYVHVRLEAEKGRMSDAFRIKIVSRDGADMSLLKAFSVSTSDFNKFEAENAQRYNHFPSLALKAVPSYSQFALDHPRKDGLCSPTSCSMLTSYFLKQEVDPIDFAEKSYDHGLAVYGSWPFNMAHAFERCGGSIYFSVARFDSFAWLYAWLERGIPVVVSVRGPLQGAATPYASGHLLMVTGWDQAKQQVICHDPAFENSDKVYKRYAIKDFLEAWERSRRLSYIADPGNQDKLSN